MVRTHQQRVQRHETDSPAYRKLNIGIQPDGALHSGAIIDLTLGNNINEIHDWWESQSTSPSVTFKFLPKRTQEVPVLVAPTSKRILDLSYVFPRGKNTEQNKNYLLLRPPIIHAVLCPTSLLFKAVQ